MAGSALLVLLPRGVRAEALPQPEQYLTASWGDSSGGDGKGGTCLTVGRTATGARVLPLRSDSCPAVIEDESLDEHPAWLVFKDQQGPSSIGFEWTWVTQGAEKHWDKTWAGAGLAFDEAWSKLDARGAKFLVLMVKASEPEPAWDVQLSLNSNAGGKDANSGRLSLRAYADGKRFGDGWTRVVLPLDRFPSLSSVDLSSLSTLGLDLLGQSPENQPCWIRLDDIYFSGSDLLPSVERLGFVPFSGGVLLSWDMPASAAPERFLLDVDGKALRPVDGSRRQLFLPAASLPGGKAQVGIRAQRQGRVSPVLRAEVGSEQRPSRRAGVELQAQRGQAVSPWIFGYNNLSGEMAQGMGVTLNRWGGNRKSRYNWRDDADTAAQDWYFLNEAWSNSGKEEDKSWYKFVQSSLQRKVQVNMVVPIIDWIAKRPAAGQRLCSFPLSLYPDQKSSDGQGCGDGLRPDGQRIFGNDPALANIRNSPQLQEAWVRAIVQRFGPASRGGVRFYSLDNEPGLWSDTHRDVRPKGVGYDEVARLNIDYAKAIKAADPSATVLGLVAWGVKELAGSNLDYYAAGSPDGWMRPDVFKPGELRYSDRQRHGGLPLFRWYLQQMRRAQEQAGRRLIDVVDVHWYPECYGKDSQGQLKRLSADLPYDPVLAPQQFDALREFWDPTYVNEASWTANAENRPLFWDPFHPLIPRLKQIVAQDYPGTRLAISEYDTGSRSYYHGALLRAVALGCFMQQGLWMANSWYETDPGKFLYWAHRLYGNYDGKGGNVQGWTFPVRCEDPDLYAFASARRGKAFVIFVNKNRQTDINAELALPWKVKALHRHLIEEHAGPGIVDLPVQAVQGSRVVVGVPAWSALLAELDLQP